MTAIQQWFDRKLGILRDIACWLALFLLPWQARWIASYHELSGGRYEYGTISLYAGSFLIALAVGLLLARTGFVFKWNSPARWFVGWVLLRSIFAKDVTLALGFLELAVFAFGYYVIATRWDREKVLLGVIGSGLLQAMIAWKQFVAQFVSASTLLGIANHDPHTLGQSVVIISGARILRANGLLPHPNMLGAFLAVALALLTYLFIRTGRDTGKPNRLQDRAWQLGAIVLLFSGVLITFSRAALFAVVIMFAGWFAYGFFTNRIRQLRGLGRAGLACVALFLVFNGMTGGVWTQRVGLSVVTGDATYEQQRLDQMSADERIRTYHEAIALWSPGVALFGVGPGNYVARIAAVFPSLPSYAYQPAHNAYIMLIVEIGLVGFVFFMGFMVHLLRGIYWSHLKNILTAYPFTPVALLFVVGFFDHFLWTSYFGQSLWWLSVGIAVSMAQRR